MSTQETAFKEAIAAGGLTPPPHVLADGKFHRFPTNGRANDDSGWYIAHPHDPPVMIFGDWRTGFQKVWSTRSMNGMSSAERRAHRERLRQLQLQRKGEQARRNVEVATRASRIWQDAAPAPADHPYLLKKGIPPTSVRVHHGELSIAGQNMDGSLLVPLSDEAGTQWCLQFITDDGDKFFLPGGRKQGCFFLIGEITETVCIVEGYATGASVYEATGKQVVVAFDAGNLKPVAEAIRRNHPHTRIIICGDCDASGTGQAKANDAARVVGGIAVLPKTAGDDWNDVHRRDGLEAVRTGILDASEAMPIAHSSETSGWVKVLADAILGTNHFATDSGGALYIYQSGVYRQHGGETIAREIKRRLEQKGEIKRWSSHLTREVTEFIRVDAPRLWERPLVNTVNLSNGLFDIETGILGAHSPAHLSSIQLPIAYDPAAKCPVWKSFIDRVLPADCWILPFELVASAMCAEIMDQKAVLLVGSGENGKSTLLNAIVKFLGKENVSAVPLQRLESDKFASARLHGKLANVCPDLPSNHLSSTSTFKALTGGDALTAERKFQQSFEFTSHARLIFSTNHYPQSKDSSQALFRRWFVIPFDAVIEHHERDPYLVQKLTAPGELSGVLNQALAVLPGFRKRGGFTASETTKAAMMEFREITDPVAVWLDNSTVLCPEAYVSRKDLMITYNAHAAVDGRPPISSKAFCEAVRRLRPTIKEAQRTVCGAMQWVFLGLKLAGSASRDSRDSHHPPQISLGNGYTVGKEESIRAGSLYRADRVSGVNGAVQFEEVDLEN